MPPPAPARAPSLPARLRHRFGRRATGIVVALALEILLLLALLSLGRSADPPIGSQVTEVTFEAREIAEPEPEPAPPESDEVEPQRSEEPQPQPVETVTPSAEPAPVPVSRIPLPTAPPAPAPAPEPRPAAPPPPSGPVYGPPDTGGPPSDDSVRVGTAPNGEPLYAARWYREPGREFWGFLSNAGPGSGLMACRTIPDFYVTDCVPLGDTPGSMLNRSMLAGAGVLRVRPPRLGGRSLVGAWVRIQITYTVRQAP